MTGDNPRTPCCVPFCTRGTHTLPAGWQYLCALHYSAVPTRWKRLRARLKRKGRTRAYHAMWRRMVRLACAAAAGIG